VAPDGAAATAAETREVSAAAATWIAEGRCTMRCTRVDRSAAMIALAPAEPSGVADRGANAGVLPTEPDPGACPPPGVDARPMGSLGATTRAATTLLTVPEGTVAPDGRGPIAGLIARAATSGAVRIAEVFGRCSDSVPVPVLVNDVAEASGACGTAVEKVAVSDATAAGREIVASSRARCTTGASAWTATSAGTTGTSTGGSA